MLEFNVKKADIRSCNMTLEIPEIQASLIVRLKDFQGIYSMTEWGQLFYKCADV